MNKNHQSIVVKWEEMGKKMTDDMIKINSENSKKFEEESKKL